MEKSLAYKVKDYILDKSMIAKGERVCVAVSGGADSMCLLFLLHDISDSMGFTLSAVHVEHGIRGQASLDDMEYVKAQCDRLGIPLHTARVDAVKASEESGTTLEEAARNERYRIFGGIKADKIALAHHKNDQAETVLFNLARGTGIRGLRGMEPVWDRFIRPLLCATREEIEEYCKEWQIEYRHDATNDDLDISRNRIRHLIVPELTQINDKALEHIFDAAEELAGIEEYLAEATERAYRECVKPLSNGPFADAYQLSGKSAYSDIEIDLDILDSLHEVIAPRVIKRGLISVSGRAKDISRKHVEAVLMLAKGQSGRHISLIYGIKAYKEFRKLVIRGAGRYELSDEAGGIHKADSKPSGMDDNGLQGTDGINLTPKLLTAVLTETDVSMDEIKASANYTKFIDYATIDDASDLKVRHREPGDFISIKGGNKKLKDLLIEEKIPVGKRNNMYFVAMNKEIVWIIDTGRIGERFKVTSDTEKILRMEIKNG